MAPLLELNKISKSFGAAKAVDGVDFSCEAGTVVALLGENGAGKSTLMKIAYGMYKPDAGSIAVKGIKTDISGPRDAIRLGIQMVHQHFMLVDNLTVAENIVMGREPVKMGIFQSNAAVDTVRRAAAEYGLHVDPAAKVKELSVGAKQRAEIIKALHQGAEILILDEPTAVLTPQESEELFAIIGKLKAAGKSIIIITHKLKETMEIADEIYVLRGGKLIGKKIKKETNPEELTETMVGHRLRPLVKESAKPGEVVLDVTDLKYRNGAGNEALRGLSLHVRSGEILGIAGVEGNGQQELVDVLVGIAKPGSGTVTVDGVGVERKGTYERLNMGMACIHADRFERGLFKGLSAADNFLLGYHRKKLFKNGFNLFSRKKLATVVEEQFAMYDVRPRDIRLQGGQLSGGNQQKIVVAREFYRNPKLIIAAYPTRGVDIGAAEAIHDKMMELRKNGAAILLITSDLDELFKLSDRIGVIYEGAIAVCGSSETFARSDLGYYMGGGDQHGAAKAAHAKL